MHHLVVDEWSRRPGWLQQRDPRAKLVVLLTYLVCVSTLRELTPPALVALTVPLAAGLVLGKLPVSGVAARAMLVLPFAGPVALAAWRGGRPAQGHSLLVRAFLSAAAVLVVAGATPMPLLLRGLEGLGAPSFLVLVVQFLHRYLFVLSEQAQHMRLAALSRGAGHGRARRRRALWRAAGGALAVLFARSHARAAAIHRAMLARGYRSAIPSLAHMKMGVPDWWLAAAGVILIAGLRTVLALGS